MPAKRRKRQPSRKNSRSGSDQAPGWAWMLFGLSIGLAVALVVYLRGEPESPRLEPSVPAQAARAPATEPPVTAARETRASTVSGGASESAGAGAGEASGETGAAGSAGSPGGADFEFYELLGEIEVSVPDAPIPAETVATEYTIQAGSFQSFAEADRLRARLALLGIESAIVNAIVGNDLWFRVIIGPLSERGEINGVLRKLRDERISTLPPQPVSD